ncbi:RNA-directed DNA polymerase from mobile element jockey [Araneus ventricosus]|uniref:RNA-directed DNA polymerase from mobile element jockey n=1 Tax=Araneus ventricosus TaxID=182803 RepID=A0A4Y2HDX6_ARAVE|nr:RNA-directed DNA polymerase from mobile element jockey [Araneus ventricosus]
MAGFMRCENTGVVFLDIQKAFHRVWVEGLIHKLIKYKIPTPLIHLIAFYLNKRKFKVKVKNALSDTHTIKEGIPQGWGISPTLYSLFVNDIPKCNKTKLGLYADDTAILVKNKNYRYVEVTLNRHLALLNDRFLKWKIAINVDKIEAVFFAQGRKRHKPNMHINDQATTWSQQAKYLGVTLDSKLTWKIHITAVKNKFRAVSRKLYRLLARNSDLNREI